MSRQQVVALVVLDWVCITDLLLSQAIVRWPIHSGSNTIFLGRGWAVGGCCQHACAGSAALLAAAHLGCHLGDRSLLWAGVGWPCHATRCSEACRSGPTPSAMWGRYCSASAMWAVAFWSAPAKSAMERDARHIEVDVDAVQQQSADALLVAGNGSRSNSRRLTLSMSQKLGATNRA